MQILSASKFRDLCDATDNARVSLESCLRSEAASEAQKLARWMRELLSTCAKRPTLELDRMQIRSLTAAANLMKSRAPAEWAAYESSI